MHGKCPKCEKLVSNVICNAVDAKVPLGKTWKGISFCCPYCHTILSVQIDPIAVKTDTVSQVVKKLRG